MGDSWIVDNLNAALNTWNGKLAEIWQLLTESPQTFRGGQVWSVMVGIHGALQAIGYGLLVLFFAIGVVKTCGSFVEVKRPEHALKLFIRFALAKAAVTYGLELMQAVFSIVQGTVSTVITQSGTSGMNSTTAADDQHVGVMLMLVAVHADLEVLGQQQVGAVLVSIFSIQRGHIAPAGGAMLRAGACVALVGDKHDCGNCISQRKKQQEPCAVLCPSQSKRRGQRGVQCGQHRV